MTIITFLKRLWRKPLTRLLTSLGILGALLSNLPLLDLWHTVEQVSLFLWVAVVAAFIGGHVLAAVKWRLFINMGCKKLPFSIAFQCHFAGLFSNFFAN